MHSKCKMQILSGGWLLGAGSPSGLEDGQIRSRLGRQFMCLWRIRLGLVVGGGGIFIKLTFPFLCTVKIFAIWCYVSKLDLQIVGTCACADLNNEIYQISERKANCRLHIKLLNLFDTYLLMLNSRSYCTFLTPTIEKTLSRNRFFHKRLLKATDLPFLRYSLYFFRLP